MLETQFNLNYGTQPTTSTIEEIKVKIDPNIFISDYAKAYKSELGRRNPARDAAVDLTIEELQKYFLGILAIRFDQIEGECKVWRQAKELYIPAWIQFVISQVGRVVDVEKGLVMIPIYKGEYDINELLDISNKLQVFKPDGVSLLKDAFPRTTDGDKDLMSMAIIDGYVKAMSKIPHPIQSYVSAFLGMQLEKEAAFKVIYRIRYDDVEFIRTMLSHEETLI